MKSVIKKVNISPDETRVGVIVYSRRARLLFGLGDLSTACQINNALDNIKYKLSQRQNFLNIGAALEMARQKLFNKTRRGAQRVLVLVTGGKAKDDIVIPSRHLKKDGVTLYTVGVGDSFDQGQLDVISSNPINNTFKSDLSFVNDLSRSVRGDVCRGKGILLVFLCIYYVTE